MSGGYGPSPTYSVLDTGGNPAGTWTWSEGAAGATGVVKAVFDPAGANPPVANGSATGFVPSFKINTAPNGKILSVDVRWFYYDAGTGQYHGPLDASERAVLRYFVDRLEVDFSNPGGGATEDVYLDPTVETQAIPTRTWYYAAGARAAVMGFYESGGFGYFFHFEQW
jgi:hypothetical protein